MITTLSTLALFVAAALCEIAGCFGVWAWLRLGRSPAWAVASLPCLIAFAWLLTRTPADFAGRAYAAYGGVYVAAALGWLWLIEGRGPDRWDLLGAGLCLAGGGIILFGPRPS
jgi:small multidrug resistance family-3 protein